MWRILTIVPVLILASCGSKGGDGDGTDAVRTGSQFVSGYKKEDTSGGNADIFMASSGVGMVWTEQVGSVYDAHVYFDRFGFCEVPWQSVTRT